MLLGFQARVKPARRDAEGWVTRAEQSTSWHLSVTCQCTLTPTHADVTPADSHARRTHTQVPTCVHTHSHAYLPVSPSVSPGPPTAVLSSWAHAHRGSRLAALPPTPDPAVYTLGPPRNPGGGDARVLGFSRGFSEEPACRHKVAAGGSHRPVPSSARTLPQPQPDDEAADGQGHGEGKVRRPSLLACVPCFGQFVCEEGMGRSTL